MDEIEYGGREKMRVRKEEGFRIKELWERKTEAKKEDNRSNRIGGRGWD